MENNLVELKLDRIERYFEAFKNKYEEEYQKNKKTTKTRFIYPTHILTRSIFTSLAFLGTAGLIHIFNNHFLELLTDSYKNVKSENTSTMIEAATTIKDIFSIYAPLIALLLGVFVLVKGFLSYLVNQSEETIEYTKEEYYSKIKSKMIEDLKSDLSDLITENMLIFDSTGLITAPNLETSENKKFFGQIEKKLNLKNE